MQITVLVPIGPYHVNVAHRAIASVQTQTAPCALATYHDVHGRGPGYGRNHLLQSVRTEFVVFLDADDWLEPTFAQKVLGAFDGRRYVYTDWFQDGETIAAPDRPWCEGKPNLITALIPVQWLKQVGGFDATLPGMEDTDMFERLMEYGYCGKRLAEPLMHYSNDGQRSKEFRKRKDYEEVKKRIRIRHRAMGCCGDVPVNLADAPGELVEARALWAGNRREVGRATGYVYPRTGNGRVLQVNRRDAEASPHLWQIIEQPKPVISDDNSALDVIGGAMFPKRPAAPAAYNPILEPAAPVVEVHPNVSKVIRLGRKRDTGDPVFIFPRKEYPSYSDFKRLVSLSGFASCYPDEARDGLHILVSPTPEDVSHVKGRVIAWQLEYAGDYTNNLDGFTGEVWSSDKAWAESHGAKYVLMGSHAGLADGNSETGIEYDVTMLGYMIPRRQAIKNALPDLRWPEDYPGNGEKRHRVLMNTRLMLHVHQHDTPANAPQRFALAAAYKMPVLTETLIDANDLPVMQADYPVLPDVVRSVLPKDGSLKLAQSLHNYLCIEHPFRDCVMEALK